MGAMKQQHPMYQQQLQPPSYNQLSSSRSSQQQQADSKSVQMAKHAPTTVQQQYHSHNTTPKKERRTELPSTPNNSSTNPGYTKSSEKKKRYAEPEPQPLFPDPIHLLNKPPAPNSNNNNNIQAAKRPYASTEQIKQEEGIDFRESKKTKLDLSPILDTKPFMSNNDLPNDLFDPDSFINSDFMFNSTVTSLAGDTKANKSFSSNVNGTETDPDVVSSILKESIGDSSLFGIGTTSSQISTTVSAQSSLSNSVPEIPVKSDPMDLPFSTTLVQPTISSNKSSLVSAGDRVAQPSDITAPISTLTTAPPSSLSTSEADQAVVKDDEYYRNKGEKKKKKEKHKHKDKDKEKSKDRDEKKKHKKDKERHKDREQVSSKNVVLKFLIIFVLGIYRTLVFFWQKWDL